MKTIDEDIKSGQFKKIYLLYGDEAYLKKQYKDKLKKALVQPDDTPKTLQQRVMEQAEWVLLPQAINAIANGRI